MSQNNFRKEPTLGEPSRPASEVEKTISVSTKQAPAFTFTPIERPFLEQNSVNTSSETPAEPAPVAEETVAPKAAEPVVAATKPVEPSLAAERVIPAAAPAAAKAEEKPKAVKSSKNRRLLIVILLALLLGLVIWLLRPSTPQTLDELQQQQGTNLPIEFRPVDEAEAKRAEEQAMQNAQAQQEAQTATTPAMEQPAENTAQSTMPSTQPMQMGNTEQPVMPQVQPVTEPAATVHPVKQEPAEPVVVSRPKTQNSVIYQPETGRAESQDKHSNKAASTTLKKLEAEKKAPATVKAQPAPVHTPVVAKPVHKEAQAEVAKTAPVAATAPASVSAKTLTVPKGVSLMQVFRDHQLNISDVNAMSKAAGANGILSNLKVGERVTVRLDGNSRVTEMQLSSGGRFIRQADGSYAFRK